ncbi:MAG: hypothetical protein CVV24_14215 [Ignavibacteriae bacterium HGW-Ignavibacteriae-3]|nr:MAG: hypothetical protein CVV24_14215 [Ignavibacteriae bacterium HGW-Ignavibacteriae-3]
MKNKVYLSLFLITISGSSLFGQLKYTFSQFGDETWSFIKQPTKWDGGDWLKLGLMGAVSFLAIETIDQPVRDAVLRDQKYYKSVPMEFGRMWGEIYSPVVFFGGFAAYSLITNDIESRKIAFEVGQASLYAAGISFVFKLAIGRSRPYLEKGTHSFSPFESILNQDNKSIPSGHSTVAFIISTVLSRNIKSPIWKVLIYIPAVLTMISRVYQDQHWVSDTFAGAALGYFVATWVVDQHEKKSSSILGMSPMYPLSIRIAL